MKMRVNVILLCLSLLATIIIYCFSRQWELDLIADLQKNLSPSAIFLFQLLSNFISFISLGIPAILLILSFFKRDAALRQKALIVIFSIALAGTLSYALKKTVREPRPYEVDTRINQWSGGGGYGFPSGHTAEAMAAASAFSLLWPELIILLISFGWAVSIMISRICLGVHDPGDVMAGMFLGLLSSMIILKAAESLKKRSIS